MHKVYLKTVHHYFPWLNSWFKKNSRSKGSREDRIYSARVALAGHIVV